MNNVIDQLTKIKTQLLNGIEIDINELNEYLNYTKEKKSEQVIEIHGFNNEINKYKKQLAQIKPYKIHKNNFKKSIGTWESQYTIARKKDKCYTLQPQKENIILFNPKNEEIKNTNNNEQIQLHKIFKLNPKNEDIAA